MQVDKQKKAKGRKMNASVTVEASLSLSLFLFFFLCMIYIYLILLTQMKVQEALEETADVQAAYAASCIYGKEVLKDKNLSMLSCSLDLIYTESSVISRVGRKFLNQSCIRGGAGGLNFTFSRYLTDGENLELIVTYKIRIPLLGISDIKMVQCAKRRVWYGYDSSGKIEEKEAGKNPVYVTEDGQAYHLFADCSYIDVKVNGISADSIESQRNKDGAKYYPCEICKPEGKGTVYIAAYGTRYHTNENCMAIERDAKEVELSQIGSRHLCSRCQKRAAG